MSPPFAGLAIDNSPAPPPAASVRASGPATGTGSQHRSRSCYRGLPFSVDADAAAMSISSMIPSILNRVRRWPSLPRTTFSKSLAAGALHRGEW